MKSENQVILMNELSYYFSQMLKCIKSLYLRRKTVTNMSPKTYNDKHE